MNLKNILNRLYPRKQITRNIIKRAFTACLAVSVCLSFILLYFFITNTRREKVLGLIPPAIKTSYLSAGKSYKALVKQISDLAYLPYQLVSDDLPVYDLYLDKNDLDWLNKNLPSPITNGQRTVLTDEYKDYKPAKFKFNGKEYSAEVRYRGDMPEHWEAEKKSWRVKFSRNNLFLGQAAINLIIPENRNFFNEYINNYRAGKMDLKKLKNTFAKLRVNGKMQGIYYVAEQWGKEFLETNGLSGDANLYGEKTMYIPLFDDPYDWKKYTKDLANKYDNYAELEKLVILMDNPSDSEFYKNIWNLIDEDTYYKWQALAVLAGSQHQDYHHNIRLYFDNTTGKFKFIPWDVFFFNIANHMDKIGSDVPYDYINRNPINLRILKNPEFLQKRNELLWNYIKDNKNIKDDLKEYDEIYKKTRAAFYKDNNKIYSNKYFEAQVKQHRKVIESNFKILQKALQKSEVNLKIMLNKNYDKGERTPLMFDFEVISYGPVAIRNIEFEPGELKYYPDLLVYYDKDKSSKVNYGDVFLGNLAYDKKTKQYSFKETKHLDFYTDRTWESGDESGFGGPSIQQVGLEKTDYRLLAIPANNYNIEEIKDPKIKFSLENSISKDKADINNKVYINGNEFTYFEDISLSQAEFLSKHPVFISRGKDKILLPQGSYVFSEHIIIPKNLELEISPGAVLYFKKNISLISYSPVKLAGTAGAPIKITALNPKEPRGVFAVVGAKGKSYFDNVIVEYGGTAYINGAFFSGALALHSSDVEIKNSQFKYAAGDDGLNIKNAKAEITDSLFYKNSADGIDMDFIKSGKVYNNKFIENGGDGLDISGTDILIDKNTVEKSGDKCISVGEKSKSTISNNYLDGCNYGIAIKEN